MVLASVAATCALHAQLPSRDRGTTVVRYPPGARAPATWRVGSVTLRVGGLSATGASSLVDVVGVFLLGDGRMLIADGESSELRLFALADGRHLGTIARRGPGPGEIDDLWRVWRTPSGFVAEDAAGKASLFTLDGRFVRVLPRGAGDGARRVERLGMFDDTLAFGRALEDAPTLGAGREAVQQARLLAVTPSASRMFARYPQEPVVGTPSGRVSRPLLRPRTVAAVANGRACVGYPARYVVDCYTPLGQHALRIERERVAAARVTAAHREDYITREAAANPGPRGAPYIAQLRREGLFAESLPMFGEFVAAANGDLWVGPHVVPGPIPMKRDYPAVPTTWSVFGTDGRWKADVSLPARFQLFAVDDGVVAGVLRDADDVEQVVMYRLITP